MRQNEAVFTVTHPCSPLKGKTYKLIERKQCWGDDRLLYLDENEDYRRILTSWTDYTPQDPFLETSGGKAVLSETSMIELAQLLSHLGEEVSM